MGKVGKDNVIVQVTLPKSMVAFMDESIAIANQQLAKDERKVNRSLIVKIALAELFTSNKEVSVNIEKKEVN